MTPMEDQLTIGIVTYNSSDDIVACINSIRKHAKNNSRIIVSDNNSTDNTREIINENFSDVDIINTGGNYGYGHAFNVLLSKTTTPYLLLLNADITIDENTIEPLLLHLNSDPQCIIAAPATYNLQGKLEGNIRIFPTIVRTVTTCLLGGTRAERIGMCDIKRNESEYTTTHNVDWLKGAIWCIRTSLAIELQGMREDFFLYSEEREFAARALDHGYVSAIVPAAQATHIGGDSDFHPILYSLLHINNIRYEIARGRYVSAAITYTMQLFTEGLRSMAPQHRRAFISHLRALKGVKREAHRLITELNGELTEPVFP